MLTLGYLNPDLNNPGLVCYFQVKVESEVLVFVRKGWGRWAGELGENQLGKDKLSTKN